MMIQIEIQSADVLGAIEQLHRKIGDMSQPMERIGIYLTNITEESFDNERSPEGDAWHPLKIRTIHYSYGGDHYTKKGVQTKHFQKFAQNRKTLQDTRTLRESITHDATDASVIVGVNAYSAKGYPYPIAHQFGTEDGRLKARPFFPITHDGELIDGAKEEVLEIIMEFLGE